MVAVTRAIQQMALMLVVGALLVGCTSGTDGPAKEASGEVPKNPPIAQAPAPQASAPDQATEAPAQQGSGQLTQREIDTAESVLVVYFDAVVNQDSDVINFLWADSQSPKDPPVIKGGKTAMMEEVKVLKAMVKDGMPTVYFEAKVDLGPSPGGSWSPGVNHRWAELQKTAVGWKVKALTTSPPSL